MSVAPEPPSAAAERQLEADAKLSPLSVDPEESRRHISEAEASGLPVKRLAQAQAQLDIALEAQRLASEGLECEFYFILASKILEDTNMKSLPRWQELRETKPDWLVRRTLSFSESIQGAYTKEYVGVSHRWETPDDPDTQGAQLSAIRSYLRTHPDIKYCWVDFGSMPQGERSEPELREFLSMLANINLVYLGASVLALVDLSYMSRFWTQFEAWLACQEASEDGLMGCDRPEDLRLTVATIHNAPPAFGTALLDMWNHRSPAEARELLSQPDVMVTNQKDKDTQLGKLLNFNMMVLKTWARMEATGQLPKAKPKAKPKPEAAPKPAPPPKPAYKPAEKYVAPEAPSSSTPPKKAPKKAPKAAPAPQTMKRYAEPPNPYRHTWFHKYKAGDFGGCGYALCCAPCAYGEIMHWSKGVSRDAATCEWLVCWPCCGACLVEKSRAAIEAKIHRFHRERGDHRATGAPDQHKGACCIAACCLVPMLGENVNVMKQFKRTQRGYR